MKGKQYSIEFIKYYKTRKYPFITKTDFSTTSQK